MLHEKFKQFFMKKKKFEHFRKIFLSLIKLHWTFPGLNQ